jgi:hypothetical protein
MFVKVGTKPNQRIDGSWNVVCSKGLGAGSRDGRFHGTAPVVDQIKLP